MATSIKTYSLIDAVMTVDISGGRQITEHMTFEADCYSELLRDSNLQIF